MSTPPLARGCTIIRRAQAEGLRRLLSTLSTSTSSGESPVGAPSSSRPRLASGIASIAGRPAIGLQGDVMGGLPGYLGIAGGILGGLMGNAGQPGSVALGSSRIASDADRVACGLSFGECRVVYPGSRAKLLQFCLLRVRGCAQPVINTRPLKIAHLTPPLRGSVGRLRLRRQDYPLETMPRSRERNIVVRRAGAPKGRSSDKSNRNPSVKAILPRKHSPG